MQGAQMRHGHPHAGDARRRRLRLDHCLLHQTSPPARDPARSRGLPPDEREACSAGRRDGRPTPCHHPHVGRQAFRKLSIASRVELTRIVIQQAGDGPA
jgi:hypothetical protein